MGATRFDSSAARLRRAAQDVAPLLVALSIAGCSTVEPTVVAPDAVPIESRVEPAVAGPAQAQPAAPSLKLPAPAAQRDTPDAVPRVTRIAPGAPNEPYTIRGETYVPGNTDAPMVETGIASWYGEPFHGRPTAIGEIYDMDAMTAAHKTMPLPSYALIRNRANGRQVLVRVNDRGPFIAGRIIDLSRAAARKLRIDGVAQVEVRRLTHADIRSGAWKQPPASVAGLGASERSSEPIAAGRGVR